MTAAETFSRFLEDAEKKTLILKGKWGVGKTYAWKRFIETCQLKELAVSYVSLFGINSVQDIWRQVLTNAVPKNVKQLRSLGKIAAPMLGILKNMPYAKIALSGSDQLAPLLARRFLICFDDIERKGKALQLSAVLGLVSVLKDENDCRVVLIFNEDQLTEEDRQNLNTYREKVIDWEIAYDPTTRKNIRLIFGPADFPAVQETLEAVDTNNIRVIKFSQWNARHFAPFLESVEPGLRDSFLRKLTILTCVFHKHGNEANLMRLQENFFAGMLEKKEEKLTDLDQLLQRIMYLSSEYDQFIIEYLKTGNCNTEELNKTLDLLNQRERAKQTEAKLHSVWSMYHTNFRATAAALVSSFRAFLRDNSRDLSLSEITQICEFVKQLGSSADAELWMGDYIQAHVATAKLDALEAFRACTNNPKIQELLSAEAKRRQEPISLKLLVYRMATQSAWSPKDESALNTFSEGDYYTWLKDDVDDDLITNVRKFHKLFSSQAGSLIAREIGKKLEGALLRLATEDPANRARVQQLFNLSQPPERAAATTENRPQHLEA